MTIRSSAAAALALFLLAGCVTDGPATGGAAVRAAMAAQIIDPHPAPGPQVGGDGVAAAAGYANYKQSYASPQPQGDSPLVGTHK